MMNIEDLKDRYFTNNLSSEEEKFLLDLVNNDPELKEEFEFEKSIQNTLRKSEKIRLKKLLVDAEDENMLHAKPSKSRFSILKIAAGFVLLIYVGWFGFKSLSKPGSDRLYAENFEQFPNVIKSFERGEAQEESLETDAFRAYELNNFELASVKFEEINTIDDDLYVDFYLAQSYMALGQFKKAERIYENLLEEKNGYYNESLWYLSLINIKLDNEEEAIKNLEKLVAIGTYKKAKAKSLLNSLE